MESSVSIVDTKGKAEAIILKITDYVYGLPDPQQKPTTNSSESVQSAYEVTEDLEAGYTNSSVLVASSSIPPPEMFKSFSMDALPLTTESDQTCDFVGKLSKSLEDLQDSPQKAFMPLGAAQSTPISKRSDIAYPKSLEFRPLEQRASSGKTAKIVHDIVFEKYKHSYKNLMQKLGKLNFSVEEQKYSQVIEELEETFKLEKINRNKIHSSADSGLDSDTNENVEEKKSLYKQFLAEITTNVPVTQVYACSVEHRGTCTNNQVQTTSSDSSDYDERTFLRTAIGDEILRNEPSENYFYNPSSINTAEISELISSQSTIREFPNRANRTRRSIDSILTPSYASSPIVESSTTTVANHDINSSVELVNEPFRYSYASYEDITNLGMEIYTDEGKKQIKKHIYINERIIGQTEKMLKYGVKMPKFIGSLAHLEGERIFLVSKTRRQVLINHMYRIPEPINEAVARVTIENVKCMLTLPQEISSKRQYFVCILQHKTTVYSTKIAAANNQGLVELGGFFIFENVSNTFNIKIQLYSVTLPKKSSSCFLLSFLRENRKVPLMALIGEVPIGMLNIKNKKFTFKNSENIKSNEHKLLASIEASVVWPEPLRGFVTVGTGKIDQYPIWNKRWCVIEEAVLNYYNYPSDERFATPLGSVDLKLCKSVDEDTVKYMSQKTLSLFIQEKNNFRRVFLSPDIDYDSWSKHLDIVLKLNDQWNNSKN